MLEPKVGMGAALVGTEGSHRCKADMGAPRWVREEVCVGSRGMGMLVVDHLTWAIIR